MWLRQAGCRPVVLFGTVARQLEWIVFLAIYWRHKAREVFVDPITAAHLDDIDVRHLVLRTC